MEPLLNYRSVILQWTFSKYYLEWAHTREIKAAACGSFDTEDLQ